ncbi:Zinc finger, RING/FYVE/PHD-type [Trema orientale]|uniref:Zinc finger, RING/FYVE/PHD-type n=1 Tax=Trema orientale TaxID=63057 RepID=A0A2P5FW69_TREOI|nr:Zinc finger, RING/FYVE/PHD-type [Trema orientale]
MVDDLMVCVDRIIGSTYFESVNNGERSRETERPSTFNGESTPTGSGDVSLGKTNRSSCRGGECSSNMATEIVECRVCQEEDQVYSMEAPCACNGTLKVFSPNYSLPPARSSDVMAIDIRQWGSHLDLRDSHLLALAAAEHHLLQSEYEDYTDANSGGLVCLCSVAVITLLIVLLIRQALMITRLAGVMQESSPFNVSLLQIAGFLFPCYVMARSWFIIQSRRRRQV